MLWLPACARARHCIVVLFPKVGKCNQTNDTYTFKQSKILQISLQLLFYNHGNKIYDTFTIY